MTVVQGNWVLPEMEGHNHPTLMTIMEVEVPDADRPGMFWLTFLVPPKSCVQPDCTTLGHTMIEAGMTGVYVYHCGQPFLRRTMVMKKGKELHFLQDVDYEIDDLPWSVSDGTVETARSKLRAYLEFSGGERVGDLDPRLTEAADVLSRFGAVVN